MTKLFITLYAIQFVCNMICWAKLCHKHESDVPCDTCTRLDKKDAYGYYYCHLNRHEMSPGTQHPPVKCHNYTDIPLRASKEDTCE